jgi:hypothetical protein
MSVRKVRRWSCRADACMVNGMKATGKGVLSGEAATGRRLTIDKAEAGRNIPFRHDWRPTSPARLRTGPPSSSKYSQPTDHCVTANNERDWLYGLST